MNEEATGFGHRPNRVRLSVRVRDWAALSVLMLTSVVVIPIAVAAAVPNLAPFTATFPGERTLENPGGEVPKLAQSFAPFQETLGISWDEEFLYVEGNGLPDHPMMAGITAWQQQVPIPHDFTGKNRFKLPLRPQYLEEPGELTLMGPIAIAVNGVPIFHALTQSGKDAYAGGELDEWGGHCGRADDYHYHIAPAHLEEIVGKGNPVAFGLDGYPIYLADPSTDKPLDDCHGYFDEEGNYRYVGELKPPYVMSYFRGQADLEDRPSTRGVRPHLQPLRGAEITAFEGNLADGYKLTYEVNGREGEIDYRSQSSGGVGFTFTDPDGTIREEVHERRPDKGPRPPRRDGGKGKGEGRKGGKKEPRDPR